MKRPSELVEAIGPAWFWKEAHATLAIFWVCNVPVALKTGLKDSVAYLVFVSLLTAVSGEMAGLHSSHVEEKQKENEQ